MTTLTDGESVTQMPETRDLPAYSFALTTYMGESTIDEFHERLTATLAQMGCSYELIFVNDGSTDRTFERLEAIFEKDPHTVCIVDFMRNAGQVNALTAALSLSRGERVVLLDTDLELAPEEFPKLAVLSDKGFDLVSAYRVNRTDSGIRRLGSFIFNFLMRRFSRVKYRDFGCALKIFDGRVVRAFNFGPMRPLSVTALMGAAQSYAEVGVRHHPRPAGKSAWTLRRLFSAFMERLVTTSPIPFHILGILCLLAALGLLILNALVLSGLGPNWTPQGHFLLLANIQVGAFIVLAAFLSMAGDLVSRIFQTLSHGPSYIIRTLRSRRQGDTA